MKSRLAYIASIVILVGIVMNGWLGYQLYTGWRIDILERQEVLDKERAPASDWFMVNRITFPDFAQGEDPFVLYDREVKAEFTGSWFVTLYYAKRPSIVACSGEGQFRYRPKITLPNKEMKMSIFMGKECGLKPGCYVGQYRIEVQPDGYPMKPKDKDIPRFCVTE